MAYPNIPGNIWTLILFFTVLRHNGNYVFGVLQRPNGRYGIMEIMWFFIAFLHNKSQSLDFSAMLRAGGHNINSCGIDTTVPRKRN